MVVDPESSLEQKAALLENTFVFDSVLTQKVFTRSALLFES
jgi:hypothetical protein